MEYFLFSLTFLLAFLPSIILVICIPIKWISYHSKMVKNLPPSLWKFPVIGNLIQLGSNPHRTLQALSKKYGPIMYLHLGSVPTLVVSSAEAAQEILKTHDSSFASRPNLTIPNILFYGCKDIVFSPYGEYWRQLKSMVVIHLLSNARVKLLQEVREKEVGRMIGVLIESCGSCVDIGGLFESLTHNIICVAALGKTSDDGLELKRLIKTFKDMFIIFSLGNYVPWLSWVDKLTGLVGRAKRIAKDFDELLEGIIEEHVNKQKEEGATDDKGHDFVDIMLDVQKDRTTGFAFERDTVKAIILDAILGGTDTTSKSLEWVMSELIRHPRVMKKLQHEVTTVAQGRSIIVEEDLKDMLYLKAVIKESLRLHTLVPFLMPRISNQDVKLMGYDIQAGTHVMVNAWAIGRDPTLWDEPEEFRPERFLENSISYKSLSFDWLPFGAGRRGCPGIQFGTAIMELALANVVYKFDFGLPNGVKNEDVDVSEKYGIVLDKKSPLLVIISPRF